MTFPRGDIRAAETFDELGLAYFRLKDTKRAAEFQGRAVAALLLSQGPDARDLRVFVEHYGYANHESINPDGFPAFTLVGTHAPYKGVRFEVELERLIADYRTRGETGAVDFLIKLSKNPSI